MKKNFLAAVLFLAAFAFGIAATGTLTHAQTYGTTSTVGSSTGTTGTTTTTPGAPNTGEKYGS